MRVRIAALVVGMFAWMSVADAAGAKVVATRDLAETAATAQQRGVPIMLVFSSEACSYCELLEEDFLEPMLISGDYDDRVLIRKLHMDHGQVRDFGGVRMSSHEFADRYDVSVTPTIVYVDANGMELAPKTVGIRTPELFGGYLDRSIDVAFSEYRKHQGIFAGDCRPAAALC